jgi:hypothetical protein
MQEFTVDSAPIKAPARKSRLPKRVALEDIVLYCFAGTFILIFWFLFNKIDDADRSQSTWVSSALAPWKPSQTDSREVLYYKAQLTLSGLRYKQADRATTGISARRNLGFLIGSIVALLGCVIAIRGTRGKVEAGVEGSKALSAKIATTSAGAFIIFIGGAIIMATLLGEDRVRVDDDGIDFGMSTQAVIPAEVPIVPQEKVNSMLEEFKEGRKAQ